MLAKTPPKYDFEHPIFRSKRNYLLYAKEHLDMWDLLQKTDLIDWEVKSTVSSLQIPISYHVYYYIKSIVGLDEKQQALYGNKHIMELSMPVRYPLEPASIYMLTDAWHPNIKSEGRFKGKICGNVDDFGVEYTLPQLVLRVGEILQYKNYLAEYTPPYPEDEKVAKWVREIAEPTGLVNRNEGKYIDDVPLLNLNINQKKFTGQREEPGNQTPPAKSDPPKIKPKIKVKGLHTKSEPNRKAKIVIRASGSNTEDKL